MSTRGTYKIYDDYMDDYFYFYVQSDNYPEGANEDARFTKGHDYYGDTEYLYDIVCLEDSQGEKDRVSTGNQENNHDCLF